MRDLFWRGHGDAGRFGGKIKRASIQNKTREKCVSLSFVVENENPEKPEKGENRGKLKVELVFGGNEDLIMRKMVSIKLILIDFRVFDGIEVKL